MQHGDSKRGKTNKRFTLLDFVPRVSSPRSKLKKTYNTNTSSEGRTGLGESFLELSKEKTAQILVRRKFVHSCLQTKSTSHPSAYAQEPEDSLVLLCSKVQVIESPVSAVGEKTYGDVFPCKKKRKTSHFSRISKSVRLEHFHATMDGKSTTASSMRPQG